MQLRAMFRRGWCALTRWVLPGAVWVLACLILAVSVPGEEQKGSTASRPNIVWFLLDACRAENLSCYGYERPTSPCLDQLAAEGVVFEQNYAQAFGTTASVPSYMTGKFFPASCLETGDWRDMFRIPPENEQLLPRILRENGYETLLVSAHPWITPNCRLWDAFDEQVSVEPDSNAEPYASFEQLNQAITSLLDKKRQGPFFLYIHALDTHFPHRLAPSYERWVDDTYESPNIRNGVWRSSRGNRFTPKDRALLRALHDGSILYTDTAIAACLEGLKSRGLYDNTLFIVGADHGEALGEDGATAGHGFDCHEVMHVPLIMMGPGLPAAVRTRQLTQNADIVPTLAELLDLRTAASFDGVSLVPLIQSGGAIPVHKQVFAKVPPSVYDGDPVCVLRDMQFTYTYDTANAVERLYAAPDRLADRIDRSDAHPDQTAARRQTVLSRYVPLSERYHALPYTGPTCPFTETLEAARVAPLDAIVAIPNGAELPAKTHEDNRWVHADKKIWSTAWRENAPPLTLTFNVPNATYHVLLELYSNKDHYGHPATSISVKAQEDTDFRQITEDSGKGYVFVDAGEYIVDDGEFSLTIDEPGRSHWAILRRVRFVPQNGIDDEESKETMEERERRLRALGYL
jgi:arylsulfatase A-like enzyme